MTKQPLAGHLSLSAAQDVEMSAVKSKMLPDLNREKEKDFREKSCIAIVGSQTLWRALPHV